MSLLLYSFDSAGSLVHACFSLFVDWLSAALSGCFPHMSGSEVVCGLKLFAVGQGFVLRESDRVESWLI